MTRPFDIVLFGATGFTGGKTAEYLVAHAPDGLRWAIAGRNGGKLEAVRARLTALSERGAEVGLIQAGIEDELSLQRMAGQTRVLLTTVGPFEDYGQPVVRACVEQGTDYVDSSGEPYFVQQVLENFGRMAAERKVRIVSCCGFDSIPADFGALFTVQQLPADQPIALSGYVRVRGVFSGGTERSAIKALARPSVSLQPPPAQGGRRVAPASMAIQRKFGGWAAPLRTVDPAIVLRSASSLERYGPDFSYGHYVLHPSFLGVLAAGLFFGVLALLVRLSPLRVLFLKMAKESGQGPTDAQIREGWFKFWFVGCSGGQTVRTSVSGGDPGYGETSKMLAESALCLALDRDVLPPRAGVLTPVEALGEPFLRRLQDAGLRFSVLRG